MRVPAIRYPKHIKNGTVIDELCLNIDIAPTILDFANLKIPKYMQGESMKNLLKGKHKRNWRKALFEYCRYILAYAGPNQIAVRTDRYKLIDNFLKDDIDELYDLVKDPGEMVNLINSPEYQNVENELRDTAEDLKEKYKYNPDRDWWLRQVIKANKSRILNN